MKSRGRGEPTPWANLYHRGLDSWTESLLAAKDLVEVARDSSRRSDLARSGSFEAVVIMSGTELVRVSWPQGCLPEGLLTQCPRSPPSPVSLDLS